MNLYGYVATVESLIKSAGKVSRQSRPGMKYRKPTGDPSCAAPIKRDRRCVLVRFECGRAPKPPKRVIKRVVNTVPRVKYTGADAVRAGASFRCCHPPGMSFCHAFRRIHPLGEIVRPPSSTTRTDGLYRHKTVRLEMVSWGMEMQ